MPQAWPLLAFRTHGGAGTLAGPECLRCRLDPAPARWVSGAIAMKLPPCAQCMFLEHRVVLPSRGAYAAAVVADAAGAAVDPACALGPSQHAALGAARAGPIAVPPLLATVLSKLQRA